MEDRMGTLLGGYRLIRCIAKEAEAELYLGEQQYTYVQAILKTFHTPVAEGEATSFREEGRRLTTLFHPHLLRIFDVGIESETAFLVMDYPPGGTLRDQHPVGSALPLEQMLRYVQQIADALQYVHNQDLTHGNLRPEHLWLRREDDVLVGEPLVPLPGFSSSTPSSPYLAPEQAQGSATPASDQYTLGTIVYEWLSGAPLDGPALVDQPGPRLYRSPLRERVPALAPAIERAVLKALAPDPAQRFPTLQDFANALQGAIQSALVTPSAASSTLTAVVSSADRASQWAVAPAEQAQPLELLAKQPEVSTPPEQPPPQTAAFTSPALPSAGPSISPATQPQPAASQAAPSSASAASTDTKEESLPPLRWPDNDHPSILRKPLGSLEVSPPPERRRRGPIATGLSIILLLCAVIRLCIALGSLTGSHPSTSDYTQPTYPPPTTTLLTYRGHHTAVYSVAWSPDGKYIASGDGGSNVQVWEADNGHLLTNFSTDNLGGVMSLVWSPDGKYLATAGLGSAQVWEVLNDSLLYTYTQQIALLSRLAWSPNGEYLAAGGAHHTVLVWNALTGQTLFTYTGHQDDVLDVAWSPDSQDIASSSGSQQNLDDSVQVWKALTGERLLSYTHQTFGVDSVAWSPDGKAIASGDAAGEVDVWNASSGLPITTFEDHRDAVVSLAWSPDSQRVASASFDDTVRVWSATTGSQIYLYAGHAKSVWSVAWSPDGTKLASASEDQTVQIWSVD